MYRNEKRRFPAQRLLGAVALSVALGLLVCGGIAAAGSSGVYEKLIRLHVVAHSDSTVDQTVKLQVRDALLREVGMLLRDAPDRETAKERLQEALPALGALAGAVAAEAGCPYGAEASIRKELFPTRSYGSGDTAVTLPAGMYTALRVELGDAAGQNWWCVLYPPLCFSSSLAPEAPAPSADPSSALLEAGLTKDETAIIVGEPEDTTVRFRFKLLEFLGGLFRS